MAIIRQIVESHDRLPEESELELDVGFMQLSFTPS